jgi:hypothetical protein
MTASDETVLFREVQRFRQPWLWIVVLSMLILAAAPFTFDAIRQLSTRPPGGPLRAPSLFFIGLAAVTIFLAVAVLLVFARLEVEVLRDGLRVRFFPFHRKYRRFSWSEIQSAEARTYRPIIEYGGWGIRYSILGGWAYNVRGNRGVQLVFKGGKRVLLGSQKADELARAIETARGSAPP